MIQNSELILNPDGSLYHINLKPENIAHDIIFVGDQERVEKITNQLCGLRPNSWFIIWNENFHRDIFAQNMLTAYQRT